jgi:hypothetical protein
MSEREAAIKPERRSESSRRERQKQDLKDAAAEMARKAERAASIGKASEEARQIAERELDSLRRANALLAAENAAVAEVTIDRDKWSDSYLGADAEIGIIRRQLRNEETLRGDAERALAELRQEAEPMRMAAARLPGLEATCESLQREVAALRPKAVQAAELTSRLHVLERGKAAQEARKAEIAKKFPILVDLWQHHMLGDKVEWSAQAR